MILPLTRILIPLPKNVCYKIDWENPHSFRPKPLSVRRPKCVTLGIFLKEISKILVKRSSLELLVLWLQVTRTNQSPPCINRLQLTAALQMTQEIFAIKFCGISFHPKCIHDNHIKIPSVRVAAKKVIQRNALCFRPSLGILLKEISKILVKRSSLELLILLLMHIYFLAEFVRCFAIGSSQKN